MKKFKICLDAEELFVKIVTELLRQADEYGAVAKR